MTKNLTKFAVLSALVLLAACSSTQKKEETAAMNTEIQAQPPVANPEQMLERAAQSFSNIEGLSPEKKAKLTEIYTRTYTESMNIRRELGQSKSLLFKTLAKPDYKTSEIKNLKKKIVSLDQKRLDVMFKALDDVQSVVGKGADAEKVYKQLEGYDTPNRMMMDQSL